MTGNPENGAEETCSFLHVSSQLEVLGADWNSQCLGDPLRGVSFGSGGHVKAFGGSSGGCCHCSFVLTDIVELEVKAKSS